MKKFLKRLLKPLASKFGMIRENKYLYFDRPINKARYFFNYVRAFLLRPVYHLMFFFFRPGKISPKKYYVSICAIFKDEGDYLQEWLEFHKIVGIEHFYLYNNFSSDNYMQILEPYIASGEVTLIDWPIPQGQMSAYQDCFDKYRNETNWLAFIDLDEFIVPNKMDSVGEFLKPFEAKRPAILIYWRMFGSSGIINRDVNGLVIEDFKVGWKKYIDIGKIIFNTSYDLDVNYRKNGYMHIMWGRCKGVWLPPVNIFGWICLYGINTVPNEDLPIQINHYLLKSYIEYYDRKTKRGGGTENTAYDFHNSKYFRNHEKRCQFIDLHVYKYLIFLKLKMSEKQAKLLTGGGVQCLESQAA